MYLIVGLGNPENEYENTRHNMGFNVINQVAEDYKIEVKKDKFKGLYALETIEEEKVIFLKPQTYMNSSGESVILFKNFYKIPNENIIVIYDDIDLDIGEIRIRKKGGAGTHNGMRSVVSALGGEDFPRVRVGIGAPNNKEELINYVIGKIPKEEREMLNSGVEKAAKVVKEIIKSGIDSAMNKYN